MTNYKQLCAELVHIADALDSGTELASNQGQAMDGYAALAAFRDVAHRARAALPEPEPEGPTDEEIMELMPQQMRDDLAAAARSMAGFDPDNIKAASVFRIILNRHSVDHSRAVLARWGNCQGSLDTSNFTHSKNF